MIPTAPDQFTAPWLEQVLAAPEASLGSFIYAPLGTGQMCDSYRLELDWNGWVGPSTIIAKCPSQNEQSLNIAALLGGYSREVSWYRELAAQSSIACPRCYHAEIADNRVDFALLLGDCAPAKQGDQLAGAGIDILQPAIDQLAALHAPFWNKDIVASHPWIANDARTIVIAALPSLAEAFAERYEGRLAAEILELGRALAANIEAYVDWPGCASSVVHNDFRIDNLLIARGGGITVVDWQTVGIGSPISDLAYLIGTSFAEPDERAANETALFEYYLRQLAEHDIPVDRDAAWRDYRIYALSGFLMAIFASMNVERTERGDEMFALMAERPAWQAITHDSLSLIA